MIINTMLFYYLLILTSPTNCLSIFDHFVGLALKGLKYFLKKREQHNKGALFYNSGFRHLLNACIEDWSKFHAELVCFLFLFLFFFYLFIFFFWWRKELLLKALLTCTFIAWLLKSWFAKIRFRIVNKTHTKGVADIFKVKEIFERRAGEFWEGGKLFFLRWGEVGAFTYLREGFAQGY